MNEEYQRKTAMSLLDHSINYKRNVVVINSNSFKHELAKFLIAWELYNNDSPFVTEALFKHRRGKADIFELDTMTAYEIIVSETEERLKSKEGYYPTSVTIVGIKADEIIKKHLKGLI